MNNTFEHLFEQAKEIFEPSKEYKIEKNGTSNLIVIHGKFTMDMIQLFAKNSNIAHAKADLACICYIWNIPTIRIWGIDGYPEIGMGSALMERLLEISIHLKIKCIEGDLSEHDCSSHEKRLIAFYSKYNFKLEKTSKPNIRYTVRLKL